MKKAIIYIRVSTDKQAEQGFSLPAQESLLRQYCKSKNIEVVELFKDDYSAKDGFDRPGYTKLKNFVGNNKQGINYLYVTQWSRYSRDLVAAFGEYYRLKALGITVNAIEQPVDFSIPENLVMASIYFALPQVENERLSLRTISGMRQAVKQGRYIYTPPKGYKCNTVTKDIEIDEPIASIIRWAFLEYAKGIYTSEEVRKEANRKGLKVEKSTFLHILSNRTYTGKVFLKSYNNEPEQWLNGLHTPIIEENLFNRVQQVKNRKSKPHKQGKEDIQNALPLRGHLLCPDCGHKLTGGKAKGNGGKYPYYHCQPKKYNCKKRFPAKIAHSKLVEFLKGLEPKPEVINLFTAVLSDIFSNNDNDRLSQKKLIESQIEAIDKRIDTVANDYADGNLPVQEYKLLKDKFEDQKNKLVMIHTTFIKTPPNFDRYITYSTGLLQNISNYYMEAEPSIQNRLIGLIFPENLTFTGEEYKTEKTNETLALICSISKGLKEKSPAKIARLYNEAPPVGLEPTTLRLTAECSTD